MNANKMRMNDKLLLIELVNKIPTETPCSECINFCHGSKKCKLADEVVPEEIRAEGCEVWVYDKDNAIPF